MRSLLGANRVQDGLHLSAIRASFASQRMIENGLKIVIFDLEIGVG